MYLIRIIYVFVLFFPFLAQAGSYPSWEQQVDTARHMHWGITEFTGAHFQSCEPLFHPDEDPIAIVKDVWGQDPNVNQSQCVDRRDADFRYVSFGTGSLSSDAGHLKLKNNQLNSLTRFNCSGFAAGTFTAAGYKHYKSQSGVVSPTTAGLRKVFNRTDTCFFKPWIGTGRSLLPGDYINVSHGHVVRVYKVGDDPLGLKKVKTKADCENIKKGNFDFTFAHSSSYNKGADVSGVKVETAKNATTSLITKLARFTRELCYDTFKDGKMGGRLKDVKVGEKKVFLWSYDQVFSVRRHYGAFKGQCVMDPAPYTRRQWCLTTSCYWNNRQESHWFGQ